MLLRNYARLFTILAAVLAPIGGCGDDDDDGASSGGSSGSSGTGNAGGTGGVGADSGAAANGGGFNPDGGVSMCQNHVYECGDTLDNDKDGLIDAYDPDCLGPCDATEGSYYGGIPGQNNAPCKMDCYFDQDTGPGNDDCYWSHECDQLEVAPNYPPEGEGCKYDPKANTPGTSQSCDQLYNAQSDVCGDYCGPLTPNGCDCFGCCELPAGTGQFVWLGSTVNGVGSCDRNNLNDPLKCKPCTPVKSCLNGCGKCEICIGKETLPQECFPDAGTDAGDGGVEGQCPATVQPCGLPGQDPCKSGFYCITGCCQAIPS